MDQPQINRSLFSTQWQYMSRKACMARFVIIHQASYFNNCQFHAAVPENFHWKAKTCQSFPKTWSMVSVQVKIFLQTKTDWGTFYGITKQEQITVFIWIVAPSRIEAPSDFGRKLIKRYFFATWHLLTFTFCYTLHQYLEWKLLGYRNVLEYLGHVWSFVWKTYTW